MQGGGAMQGGGVKQAFVAPHDLKSYAVSNAFIFLFSLLCPRD